MRWCNCRCPCMKNKPVGVSSPKKDNQKYEYAQDSSSTDASQISSQEDLEKMRKALLKQEQALSVKCKKLDEQIKKFEQHKKEKELRDRLIEKKLKYAHKNIERCLFNKKVKKSKSSKETNKKKPFLKKINNLKTSLANRNKNKESKDGDNKRLSTYEKKIAKNEEILKKKLKAKDRKAKIGQKSRNNLNLHNTLYKMLWKCYEKPCNCNLNNCQFRKPCWNSGWNNQPEYCLGGLSNPPSCCLKNSGGLFGGSCSCRREMLRSMNRERYRAMRRAGGDCFLMSLRETPQLWIYEQWPNLYPPFLLARQQCRCLGHCCLLCLAALFWLPCLLCIALCQCCYCACCNDCC